MVAPPEITNKSINFEANLSTNGICLATGVNESPNATSKDAVTTITITKTVFFVDLSLNNNATIKIKSTTADAIIEVLQRVKILITKNALKQEI